VLLHSTKCVRNVYVSVFSAERTAGGQDFQSLTVDDSLHSLKDYSSEFLPQNYEMIKEEDDDPDPEPSAAVSEAPTIVPAAADVSDKQPDAKGDVDNDKDADAVSADIKPDLDKENVRLSFFFFSGCDCPCWRLATLRDLCFVTCGFRACRLQDWRPQSIRDGLLEVVGLRSSLQVRFTVTAAKRATSILAQHYRGSFSTLPYNTQVGMIYVNVSSAVRICQGSEIVIRMKEGIELPVQV
jgi:hypothetical protein